MSYSPQVISIDNLSEFCIGVLRACGVGEADSRVTAQILTTTDAWGVFTHGTKALRGYLRRLKGGGLAPRGVPSVVTEGRGWAVVDGDSSLGMVTSTYAMDVALAKARYTGLGYVGVRNSCHFGAAGAYAAQAARSGFIGLAMANDIPSVAAPGSRGAVTGSNPLAYAVPAGRHHPLMLDMSIATVAGGKVYAARERGEPIPATWLIDDQGRPTDDPQAYPEHSTLTPAAGHKGFGLALLIETLAGALTGAAMTARVGSWLAGDLSAPTHHGAAFLALDVAAIGPDLPARIESLIDEIHAAPRAAGVDRLYVPGEKEWENLDRSLRDGIALPPDVVASLGEAAAMGDMDLERYLKNP
jgi:ureidoglycolate dehydrogenase (NAD+)